MAHKVMAPAFTSEQLDMIQGMIDKAIDDLNWSPATSAVPRTQSREEFESMNADLKAKIAKALETPDVPIQLTPAEAAELDAYVALVSYFESQNIEMGHA